MYGRYNGGPANVLPVIVFHVLGRSSVSVHERVHVDGKDLSVSGAGYKQLEVPQLLLKAYKQDNMKNRKPCRQMNMKEKNTHTFHCSHHSSAIQCRWELESLQVGSISTFEGFQDPQ